MMRHACLALLMMCSPLAAQEAVIEPGVVEACFDKTARAVISPDCLGQPAAACASAHPQPDTTLAISQCMMAEMAEWDVLLNREYEKTRTAFAKQPGLAESLLAAQRAWIAFRDADCQLAYDKYGNGSMRVISSGNCQMRHTAQRTFQLRDLQGF